MSANVIHGGQLLADFGSRPLTPVEYAHAQALVTESLKSAYKPAEGTVRSEREIEFADFEVKVRQFILELTQPTIRKCAALEYDLKNLQDDVNEKTTQIENLMRLALKVEQQVSTVDSFRLELAKYDAERKQWQAEATESLAQMKQDQEAFRYQLERQESSMHSSNRTVDRITGELGRVQDMCDGVREHVDKRLFQQNKTLNTFKTDLEVKLVNLETRHNKLGDDLWSEETGLAKVMHDLSKTQNTVSTMSADISAMKYDKVSVHQLQAVQEEVTNFTNEANTSISSLRASVDRMMNDVKDHFKTATNTVAAHNAVMLQEVRNSYQEKLSEVGRLRDEVAQFISSETQNRLRLEESLSHSQGQTEELLKKVCTEVEDVGKMRRRDRNSAEVEIRQLQHVLETVQANSERVTSTLEHISGVMWTMVQCERAASALDLQDDQDRSKVALIGYKDQVAKSKGELPKKGSDKDFTPGPVIDVDQRCLSCSGKASTVLSGFKMACLQYAPAPVAFAKKFYNRTDLLNLRDKLLMQANEALRNGPLQGERPEIFGLKGDTPLAPGTIAETLAVRPNSQTSISSQRTNSAQGRQTSGTPNMPPLPARALATPR